MEKKKLLLVAISVGVALLLVIGIPLLVIAPKQRAAVLAQNSRNTPPATIDNGFNIPVQPEVPAPVVAVEPVETALVTPIPPPVVPPEAAPPAAPETTTITVPVPRAPAVPTVQVKPAARAPVRPKSAPAAPKSAPKPKAVPKPATPKPASAAAPKYDNYWVQTGAFSTKVRAEGARESLASKGITSIIDNRDISGKTMYRVRVGPYTTESEAIYWLALVKEIDGFAESQIRLSQSAP